MDHGNLAVVDQGEFPERMCRHGNCCHHNPELKPLGQKQQLPNPWFFGLIPIFLFWWHCGSPLRRYKVVQRRQCQKCGRIEDQVDNDRLGVCLCCGYHTTIHRYNLSPR